MSGREFRLAGISPGTYYWRLKATSRSGQTTNWNEQWKFTIVEGASGSRIDASDFKAENVGRMVAFCALAAGVAYVRGRGGTGLAAGPPQAAG